jgi:[ribosomal protein S18]-alanine N-acetyltransferase
MTAPDSPNLVSIHPLVTEAEARACAEIMASNDPWRRLGRTFDESCRIVRDPAREVYVATERGADARDDDRHDDADRDACVAGFVVVIMQGAFVGYIQTVAVREDRRGRGLGSALIDYAEERIFRDQPNVFICVSSFNPGARRLYERLGYHVVGELVDYIIRGHSEILLRKTKGSISGQ